MRCHRDKKESPQPRAQIRTTAAKNTNPMPSPQGGFIWFYVSSEIMIIRTEETRAQIPSHHDKGVLKQDGKSKNDDANPTKGEIGFP